MKKLFGFVLVFLLNLSFASAQKLTTGILSGSNFSNIRGDNRSGEWKSKTGSVSGIWFNYAFNSILSIGTEFNYISLYYQHFDYIPYSIEPFMLSDIMQPEYNNPRNWDFNFCRFPLYLKLSTPTKLRFEIAGGVYYSLLQTNNNSSDKTYPKSDFGRIFSAGFAYPITKNIEAFIQGRYTTGNKEYISDNKGKNGSSELVFGIGYSGLFNRMDSNHPKFLTNDSTDGKLAIKYRSGVNVSWTGADKNVNSYSCKTGFTTGFAINYSLGKNCGIQTELLFENKGYHLKDSTFSYYKSIPNTSDPNHTFNTKTRIETTYFTIPLLFELKSSNPLSIYFNTGPYFSTLINAKTTGTQISEYRYNNSYNKSKTTINDNIEGAISHNDWGWIIGGGIQVPLIYNWKLDIEGRYQGSWSNILTLPAGTSGISEVGSTQSLKYRSITLLFGLQVPIY